MHCLEQSGRQYLEDEASNVDEDFLEENKGKVILVLEQSFPLLQTGRVLGGKIEKKETPKTTLNDQDKEKSTTQDGKSINLGPNGFLGVLFTIGFFLIVFLYFGMILQTGEFNPKVVSQNDKMPLGKEY